MKKALALVAVVVLALLGGCKTADSMDGEYEGTLTVTEDVCTGDLFDVWTVLDVRVQNEGETLADLVLVDYDYFLRDVTLDEDGSFAYHLEENSWFTVNVTDASGVLDGATASVDITIAVFVLDENGLPQEDELCHLSYTFVGDKR